MDELIMEETADADCFVRRDRALRTETELESFLTNLQAQLKDMEEPYIYPNPTRDCGWCQFKAACLLADDKGDFEGLLADQFVARKSDEPAREKQIRQKVCELARQQKTLDFP